MRRCSSSGSSRSTRCATSPRPARPAARCRGRAPTSWSKTPRRPTPPASTSRCSPPAPPARVRWRPRFAAAGAIVIDNSSAWRMDPDVPLVVSEVNPHALGTRPEGHHRQPQLHHHGRHAGAQAAARRGRPRPPRRRAPTRRCPVPGWPAWTSSTSRCARSVDGAAELTYDGGAVDFPAPVKFAAPIAFNVLPLAGKIVDDGSGETDEEQKLRNESRKILEHPRPARVGHVRAGAGLHRSLAVDQRRLRAADLARAGAPSCWRSAPGVALADIPTPLMAAGQGSQLRRAHPARRHGRARARAVRVERQPPQGRRPQRHPDRRARRRRVVAAVDAATPAPYRRAPMAANRRWI